MIPNPIRKSDKDIVKYGMILTNILKRMKLWKNGHGFEGVMFDVI